MCRQLETHIRRIAAEPCKSPILPMIFSPFVSIKRFLVILAVPLFLLVPSRNVSSAHLPTHIFFISYTIVLEWNIREVRGIANQRKIVITKEGATIFVHRVNHDKSRPGLSNLDAFIQIILKPSLSWVRYSTIQLQTHQSSSDSNCIVKQKRRHNKSKTCSLLISGNTRRQRKLRRFFLKIWNDPFSFNLSAIQVMPGHMKYK